MPLTIQSSFDDLSRRLTITALQNETVLTRQENVRKAMTLGFEALDSFVGGSYSRGTMIAPLNEADIDIFVILKSEYFHRFSGPSAQASLLDSVRRTLLSTYTRTPNVSRSGQAVAIRFSDFIVDVVPAFYRQGGGLLIPNSISQKWLATDPRRHIALMAEANRSHEGRLVPVIRMLKGWNRSHSSTFRSFHLEVLALEVFANIRISDYPSGVRYFFDKAPALVRGKNPDPAGYGDDVGSYINSIERVEDAVTKLQRAYEQAVWAEEFARRGQVDAAINRWQKVFGDYFPAYG